VILAIFGKAGVGKTAVAADLGVELRVPVRHCGRAISCEAVALGVPVSALSAADHKRIDTETVAWALSSTPCIIEGRFLDCVLAQISEAVILVEFIANGEARLARLTQRNKRAITETELHAMDRNDETFRERMFSDVRRIIPINRFDTTNLTIPQCVNYLMTCIPDRKPQPG
jgi:cytidylate kinase